MEIIEFRTGKDPRLIMGNTYTEGEFTGTIRRANLRNTSYYSFDFRDLDARDVLFNESDFIGLRFSNVDLRGANLKGVKHLEEVRGLSTARFNDDTIIDDVDIEQLAKNEPEIAAKLRQIRKIGLVKRNHLLRYWIWRISCDCGRSLSMIFAWLLFLSVPIFGLVYWIGQLKQDLFWLPHLTMTQGCNKSLSMWQCFEFSSMTFTNYNFPGVEWYNEITGMWIAIEVWFGVIFLGVFVSVFAARVVRNE